ncbi:hypothetical protein ACTFIZ_010981 [Dictyostelium cf. discoideum]
MNKEILDASKLENNKNSDIKNDILEHLSKSLKKICYIIVWNVNDINAKKNILKLKETLTPFGFEFIYFNNINHDLRMVFNSIAKGFKVDNTKAIFLFYIYGPYQLEDNKIKLSSLVKIRQGSDEIREIDYFLNILVGLLKTKEDEFKKAQLNNGVMLSWEKIFILDLFYNNNNKNNNKNNYPLEKLYQLYNSPNERLILPTMDKISFIHSHLLFDYLNNINNNNIINNINNNSTTTTTTSSSYRIDDNSTTTTTTIVTTTTNNGEVSPFLSILCDTIESNDKQVLSNKMVKMKDIILDNYISKYFVNLNNLEKNLKEKYQIIPTNLKNQLLENFNIFFGSQSSGSIMFNLNSNQKCENNDNNNNNNNNNNDNNNNNNNNNNKIEIYKEKHGNRIVKCLIFNKNENELENQNVIEIKKSFSNKGIECFTFSDIYSFHKILCLILHQNPELDIVIYYHSTNKDDRNEQYFNSINEFKNDNTYKSEPSKILIPTSNNINNSHVYSFNVEKEFNILIESIENNNNNNSNNKNNIKVIKSMIEILKFHKKKTKNNNFKKGIFTSFKNLFILDVYDMEKEAKCFLKELYKGEINNDIVKEVSKDTDFGNIYLVSPNFRVNRDKCLTILTSSICDRINSKDSPGRTLSEIRETIRFDLLDSYINHFIGDVLNDFLEEEGISENASSIEGNLMYSNSFEILFGDLGCSDLKLVPLNNNNNNNNNNSQ